MNPRFARFLKIIPVIVAFGLAGCGDDDSLSNTTPVDTTPPGVPVGLALAAYTDHLEVSWTPNSEPDLAGYVLERSLDRGETWSAIGAGPLTDVTWHDDKHARASYRVASIDLSSNQSAYAAEVEYIAPKGGPKYPESPAIEN